MRAALVILAVLAVGGCTEFPHDGPSTRSVPREAAQANAKYALVDLDYAVTQTIAAHPPQPMLTLAGESSVAPINIISPGDTLSVSVFEASSGGLFTSGAAQLSSTPTGASQTTLPNLTVDPSGNLSVPYAGVMHMAGLTPLQCADVITHALSKRAVNPQVTVTVVSSNANSVSVVGEVHSPGRFTLAPYDDRLLDVLAAAGGPTQYPADLLVVVSRGDHYSQIQMSDLMANPQDNIRLAPHDQVRVLDKPRKYTTFGALLHVSQTAIGDENVTLADAISRAGGLDTLSANVTSVLVFRFEQPDVAKALGVDLAPTAKGIPIVYRLDLSKPDRFFVAQSFNIRVDDMIYVSRSDVSEAKKFLDLANSVSQIAYNFRVTTVAPP